MLVFFAFSLSEQSLCTLTESLAAALLVEAGGELGWMDELSRHRRLSNPSCLSSFQEADLRADADFSPYR